jgi:alkanesulfonate monooxygenase SsuD/methylene tetrahydromethanopterin reductase-like flavin-dependent oxidoreductase (luciferase family)
MRHGFVLPQVGPMAGPQALITVARRAEELGYDSLWVTERLLFPRCPRSDYPPSADGSLPAPSCTTGYRFSLPATRVRALSRVAGTRRRGPAP